METPAGMNASFQRFQRRTTAQPSKSDDREQEGPKIAKDAQAGSHLSLHTGMMPSTPSSLRLYPTEAAAKKAGLALADFRGERLSTVLYALLPEGEKKPTYLLSSAYRLTVGEKRWVEEHAATVTKLGTFHPGRNFAPLQTRMVRQQKPAVEQQQ